MKEPKNIGSIEFKAILPPALEDELILLINSWFPDKYYKLESGMTKTTIVFATEDYVYKIPHNGIYVPLCEKFDDIPTKMYFSKLKENACEKERWFYLNIPDYLKKFFLSIDKYEIKGSHISLYKQEKVGILAENMPEMPVSDTLQNLLEFNISTYWLNRAVAKYGFEDTKDFILFMNDHLDIAKDLCNSNLGMTKECKPVVVDYSGFYSYVDEKKNSA